MKKLIIPVFLFTTSALAQNLITLGEIKRNTGQPDDFSKGAWCAKFMGKKCSVTYGDKKTKLFDCDAPPKAVNKYIKSAARFVGMEPQTSEIDSALMLMVGMASEGMNDKEPNIQYDGYDFTPDGNGVVLTPPNKKLIVKTTGALPDGSPSFKEDFLKKNNLVFDGDRWKEKSYMEQLAKQGSNTDDAGVTDIELQRMTYANSWEGTGADNFYRERKRLAASGLLPKDYLQEIDNPKMLVGGQISKTPLESNKGLPNFLFSEKGCNELNNVPRYVDSHPNGTRKDPEELVNKPFYEFNPALQKKSSQETNVANNDGSCNTSVGTGPFGVYCQGYNKGKISPDCGTTYFSNAESATYATAALWRDSQKRFRSMEKVLRARYPNFTRPLKDEEIVFWTKAYFNGGQGSQASADIMFQYYAEKGFLKSDNYLYQEPKCAQPCSMIPMFEIWKNARISMDTFVVLKNKMAADPKACLNDTDYFPEKDGKNYDLNLKQEGNNSDSRSQSTSKQ